MCIPPQSQTPRCASYRGVELRGVHPTAESCHLGVHATVESSSAVCIILWSQVMKSSQKTPRCASHWGVKLCSVIKQSLKLHCESHRRVNNLSSVCFIRSFTNAISLWCLKIFIRNWYCTSQIVQVIFFTSKFFKKMKWKDVASTKTRKTDIFESVWLRGVHPTAESNSEMCITPRSQGLQISQKTPWCASYRRVRLCVVLPTAESKCTLRSQNQNLYECLGAFKGTIRRNPEQFYHVGKDLKKKNFIC